jgi:excisionase family DNA binding protein
MSESPAAVAELDPRALATVPPGTVPEPEPQSACIGGVAAVSGSPAWWIAKLLTRHCREQIEDLPLHVRASLEDAIDALRAAGEHCAIAARGSVTLPHAETAVCSSHEQDELDSDAAADMLKVSVRRVRQLAAAGHLPAHQKRGRWTFSTDDVTTYRESKTGGTQ